MGDSGLVILGLVLTGLGTLFGGLNVYFAAVQVAQNSRGGAHGGTRVGWINVSGGLLVLALWAGFSFLVGTLFLAILNAPSRNEMMQAAWFSSNGPPESPVERSTLPIYWPQAVVASQDPDFYDDWGFHFMEGRALSISEMLANDLSTSRSSGLLRRVQNTALALWIERNFTKDEIVWLYLHKANFGEFTGFAEVSRAIFGREPAALGLHETAQVIGLIGLPPQPDIDAYLSQARARGPTVLYAMSVRGFIGDNERENTEAANAYVWPMWADEEDVAETAPRYEPGAVVRDTCNGCPQLVVVPSGSFLMGSPASQPDGYATERPAHRVRVEAFALGRYETTFGEWSHCVAAGYCRQKTGRDSDPVHNVTWSEAQDFIAWLNRQVDGSPYRLPSEAEWEYGARAGSNAQFFWGSSVHQGCEFANLWDRPNSDNPDYAHCDDGHNGVAPVGRYRSNNWGLYDVTGNVWEWVEDCFQYGYRGAPADGSVRPTANCESRVLRGGSSGTFSRSQRVAFRGRLTDDFYVDSRGFRVARDL